ncbi:MAG: RHS repeat-associated core domain-containing protein [Chitinophagales bacterium]
MLRLITGFNGINEEYSYDNYNRVNSYKKTIAGVNYISSQTYDACNNVATYTYPSGLLIKRYYDANGYLTFIKNSNDTKTIFETKTINAYNEYSSYVLGNGKTTTLTFDAYGKPINYLTPNIQNLSYTYNDQTGNITRRTDAIKSRYEDFGFDGLDRLISMQVNGQTLKQINYADNGNITQKTDAGTYTYDPDKIHAVSHIKATIQSPTQYENSDISINPQYIEYTPFNQPSAIYEQSYIVQYTYSANYQRAISVFSNGDPVSDRLYFQDYEVNRDIIGGQTQLKNQIHYIQAGGKIVCMIVRENGVDKFNYTYTDNLGSILTVTNESAVIIAEQNFDAWGRYRDPNTWQYISGETAFANNPQWLYRGYTGHEHLAVFDLINMNGRIYDPIIGRFLSPDNYIEDPYSAQGYNRYSYGLNNPLKYSDPSGQVLPVVAIAAIVGAAIGGIANFAVKFAQGKINGFWDGFKAFGVGAIAGAVGGASGAYIAGALASVSAAIGTFGIGFISSAIASIPTNLIQSIANHYGFGDQLMGLGDYVKSAFIAGVTGGALNVLGSKIAQFIKGKSAPAVSETTPNVSSKNVNTMNNKATPIIHDGESIIKKLDITEFIAKEATNPHIFTAEHAIDNSIKMEKIVSNILDWDKGGLLSRGSNSIITKFNGQIYRINVFIDKAGTVLPGGINMYNITNNFNTYINTIKNPLYLLFK